MIFKWNVFSVFFVSTFIFSTLGVMLFPFVLPYVKRNFWAFNLNMINNEIMIKTQIIAVLSLLLVLYSYALTLFLLKGKVVSFNHLEFNEKISYNLSKTNYFFVLLSIMLFLIVYLVLKRNVLIIGIFDGLIGRNPNALILSRRGITESYLYSIITYNLLPFLSVVSLYIYIRKKSWNNLILLIFVFLTSFFLILLLFQKRPLILFLLTFILVGFVINRKFKKKKRRKIKFKGSSKRKYLFYGAMLFSLLLLLYYSATTYQFANVYEAVVKLSEVTFLRIVGRLAIPPFYYVHHFPEIRPHYQFSNIGLLTKIFPMELFQDRTVLFKYYSPRHKEGSLAVNALFDFYGAFGYYGVAIGSMLLGFFLAAMDIFLNKLEKNGINIIFIVFSFVFAYYLSQASVPRSLLGYGFLFFVLLWGFLQRGFKIKLRK